MRDDEATGQVPLVSHSVSDAMMDGWRQRDQRLDHDG